MVELYQGRVRGFLRRLTSDADCADDLAQDCFVQAWERLHLYSGRGSLCSWLLAIAWRLFLQHRRRRQRYEEVLQQLPRPEQEPPIEADCDLEQLLRPLGERQRAAMMLHYGCDLSQSEVASVMGLPAGTVKSLIFRAHALLRQQMTRQTT